MPQKRNPDFAELARGKTGRVVGNLVSLLTVLKGLPLTYHRDLQEDKEGFFDTLDTLLGTLRVMTGMYESLTLDEARLRRAAEADAYDYGDGAWFCAEPPFRALRPTLPGWMPRVNEIIKLIGSHNLLATPAKAGLENAELRPWLDRYLPGAGGGDAQERSRLFRTAWDFVGSALGARTELYERYYLASAARTYTLAHIAAQKDREWAAVPELWAHLDGVAHG